MRLQQDKTKEEDSEQDVDTEAASSRAAASSKQQQQQQQGKGKKKKKGGKQSSRAQDDEAGSKAAVDVDIDKLVHELNLQTVGCWLAGRPSACAPPPAHSRLLCIPPHYNLGSLSRKAYGLACPILPHTHGGAPFAGWPHSVHQPAVQWLGCQGGSGRGSHQPAGRRHQEAEGGR